MRPLRWWYATAPAIAGIVAGLTILTGAGDIMAIGATVLGLGLFALLYTQNKAWITDTSYERGRLRGATLMHDQAREQASAGYTMQLAERERHRAEHAAAMQAAEEAKQAETQRADQRIADETKRLGQQQAEWFARVKTESYEQGAIDALSGKIDKIVGPTNVFRLEDRRPPEATEGPASGTEGRP